MVKAKRTRTFRYRVQNGQGPGGKSRKRCVREDVAGSEAGEMK